MFKQTWRMVTMMVAGGVLGGWAASGDAGAPSALARTPAQECGSCHQEIYQQWQQSMHAKSTAIKDPVHAMMYASVMGDPTKEGVTDPTGKYPVCLHCHAPLAARTGSTRLDEPAVYSEGVNCVTCHTITAFHGSKAPDGAQRPGVRAYTFSDDRLQGSHGAPSGQTPVASPGSGHTDPVTNPFLHRANPSLFKSSDICLGCHEQFSNPNGVAICTIGDKLVGEKPAPTCQSCHMPIVDGVADHSMLGGHSAGMVKRGVAMEMSTRPDPAGLRAVVTMRNMLLHTYPNGAAFRHAVLKVTALNAQGEVIWSNFRDNPAEDPNALMMLKLVDKDGKPTTPVAATRIAGDTRLQPGEVRTVEYRIPVADVARVRAELMYYLVTKPMLEKLGDKAPEAVKKPVVAGRAEVVL